MTMPWSWPWLMSKQCKNLTISGTKNVNIRFPFLFSFFFFHVSTMWSCLVLFFPAIYIHTPLPLTFVLKLKIVDLVSPMIFSCQLNSVRQVNVAC